MAVIVASISLLAVPNNSGAQISKLLKIHQAINLAWCGNPNKYCEVSREAWRVSACESRHNIWAKNGQYLGLFQMGYFARLKYGHAWNAWVQAKAAHRYYIDAGGWGPWSCRYAA